MMITTPDLINILVADARPVRRLRRPFARALCWLLLAALILAALAITEGIRPDIKQQLQDGTYIISVGASLLTGVLAAIAAFMVSLPDRSWLSLLLPAPTLVAWLSTSGYQCLTDWMSLTPDGFRLGATARCFATLVLISLPLSLAMLVMLRYAAPLRPKMVILPGSLAVAAIAATALSLLHDQNATAIILMWNFGTAALIFGLGGTSPRRAPHEPHRAHCGTRA